MKAHPVRPASRAAQALQRREQLLATALRLFSEHGYAATSTKRIAEAAGVTEGLVFHYFGSKEALLLELASRSHTFAGRIRMIVEEGASGPSARHLLDSIAEAYAEVSADELALVALATAEAQVNAALRDAVAGGTAIVIERLLAVLSRHVRSGELRADAPLREALLGFFGGFQFFFAQHRGLPIRAFRREAGQFATAWADVCWRGMASPASLIDHSTGAGRAPRK